MRDSVERIRRQLKDKQIRKIVSLEPGRFLDALIGEYVMGLHIEERRVSDGEPPDYWHHVSIGIKDEPEVERVPNYSTVLYSAAQVLPKFKYWSMQGQTEKGEVNARIGNSPDMNVGIVGCKTIPEAICKAALISLVEENRMLDKLLEDE